MFEALATALHLGAAEPLAQPARLRHHYSRRYHARPRLRARAEEKEPEGVWPVLPREPRITVIPVVVDSATFDQRWAPVMPLKKGDRLERR